MNRRVLLIVGVILIVIGLMFILKRDRHAETLDPATRFAGSAKTDITAVDDQLQQRLRHEAKEPGNMDQVFYPAPAVTERIQSVQYEHLENQELWFDLDYQQKYNFMLVSPKDHTINAYKQATRDQLVHMSLEMHVLFGKFITQLKMTTETFNAPISALMDSNERMIRKWRQSEVRPDLLQSRQKKLSDEAFDATARLLHTYGITILPDGTASPGGTLRVTPLQQPSPSGFDSDSLLTIRDDGLSERPRNTAISFAQYTPEEVKSLSLKFIDSYYETLLDKYKYVIRDMPADAFRKERFRIRNTGTELQDTYFKIKAPNKEELDLFCSEVTDAMQDTLFDILIRAGVDVDQFT